MPGVAGYTSEMCQQAMVEEMEALFKGRTFSGQQGMKPLKIYKQFIPIQTDDDDNIDTNESPYPCLIVKETSGTIKKLTAKTQQVLIQLIFCAYDQNVDRQGYVDAVNIKEAIIQHSYAAKMLNPNKTIQVTLRAALQSENKDGGYTYTGMRIVLGGKPKELDPGTVKRASTMDSTTTLEVTRYLIEIDGVTVVDIDKFAGRYYVDEEDQREVINALI